MASLETQFVDSVITSTRRKMMTLGGTALAGLVMGDALKANAQTSSAPSDFDILNFALSLEFLGAEYYSLGLNGTTIDQLSPSIPTGAGGMGTAGTVTTKPSSTKVNFIVPGVAGYVAQLLADEIGHVTALQKVLGSSAVAQPDLDLYTSFNTVYSAAKLGSTFDPFTNDGTFLLGAFIFEDTDTSAYHGAAPLIANKAAYLPAAVAIHAVEAQHAGLVRSLLLQADLAAGTMLAEQGTQMIAALRSMLSTVGDVGIASETVTLESGSYPAYSVVDADNNSIGWARTTTEILNIVSAGNATGAKNGASYTGGFIPNGLNGTIK